DFIFSCLPHKEAMAVVPKFHKAGRKVVDLSADFRFRSAKTYEAWYQKHSAPALLKEAVYGLPELNREKIKKARLVGNPGCYPTATLLGLIPLLKAGVIDPHSIIVDAKSGVSGAGRSASLTSHFCEVNDSVSAYKVGGHRHTPEMEQTVSELAEEEVVINFTPHLIPMDRGILATLYADALRKTDTKELAQIFRSHYKNEPFIRILPEGVWPHTKQVRGTNFCDIGVHFDNRTGRVVVVSAIDNLTKGASGQAVQNMNLMAGFPETTALETASFLP
ncbi:MAG: N-acetyl-gamma-glutamyl-phosphate reductase, partial [bacterium]|nr:N-acetyl-gamma-glutamyl-phosphate reductase [bacterium]